MATSDLQDQICSSSHLLSFLTSVGYLKPFKTEPKAFVAKTIPKTYINFTDAYDMVMKLCWLTDMTKMNILL